MKRIFAIAGLLVLALAGPAPAATRTWLGSDTNWNNTANWSGGAVPGDGDDVVIPNTPIDPSMPAATYPAAGSFASFELQAGATNNCLGDTGAVNSASGGTTGSPHGTGVAINVSGNVTIAGTLTADMRGFQAGTGPGKAGSYTPAASHGGEGGGSSLATYGSVTQPTALGSGGATTFSPSGPGGGAIKLNVGGTLTLNGTITAIGKLTTGDGSAAAGGSIWLIATTFAGAGAVIADGGRGGTDPTYTSSGGGGGGRVSIQYTNSTFSGTVSVAGGKSVAAQWGQPGTLWEPNRFPTGTVGSPANVTLQNAYQYHFPDTTTRYWNLTIGHGGWSEFRAGTLQITDLTMSSNSVLRFDKDRDGTDNFGMTNLSVVGSIDLQDTASLYLSAEGVYNLSGDFDVVSGATLYAFGNTTNVNSSSGGTISKPHGIGVTINVGGNATIGGTLSADQMGFRSIANTNGPGGAGGYTPAASYGGEGGAATVDTIYGSLTQPTALGSGGATSVSGGSGGGAIKLSVAGTLTVNGTITAKGNTTVNNSGAAAGGSIWLIATTFAGAGTVCADGGQGGTAPAYTLAAGGGGGRASIEYTNSTFSGTVSVAGGKSVAAQWGRPGSLWEPKRFEGREGSAGSPVTITFTTNGYQYYFTNTFATCYWNLVVSHEWVEFHGGSLSLGNVLLTNYAYLRFGKNFTGTDIFDINSLAITGSVSVVSNSALYLPAEGVYNLASDLFVGTNSVLYPYGTTGAVNEASGGTTNTPHGIGPSISVGGNATIDGTINGDYRGFFSGKGPAPAGSYSPAGGHGGKGALSSYATYGLLTQPTALGSGANSSFNGNGPGGGAVKLRVVGTLDLDGSITVLGDPSGYSGGAGGSIWLMAGTLTGAGTISAAGGAGATPYGGGGGGRLVLDGGIGTFTGTVSVAGGAGGGGTPGQTGTWFHCQSPYLGTYSTGYAGVVLVSAFSVSNNNTGIKITRGVMYWGAPKLAWSEQSTDTAGASLANTVNYTLTGLTPETRYSVYTNNCQVLSVKSSAAGLLTISNFALSGTPLAIRVETPPKGTIVSVW